ncbi:MAG: tetratricopeptide repeat protein [Sphingobacteriaceae bacterium]|nr:tetratricopeptide repeat protein [Sphingobacteriaceae bacterium]
MKVKTILLVVLISLCEVIKSQNFDREVNIEIEKLAKSLISSRDDNFTNSTADQILKLDSNNLQAIWFKGLAQQYLKGNEDGLFWINKFLRLRPNSKQYVYRAEIKIQAKDKIGAIEDIEKALKLSSHDPYVYQSAAEIYRLAKLYKEAFLYYDSAAKYSHTNFRVYQGYIMSTVAQNNLQKAYELCNEVIDKINGEVLIPKMRYSVMYVLKANICIMQKKYEEGIEASSEAILLEQKNPGNYRLRARCYFAAGKMDLACADYYEMLKLDPRMKMEEPIDCKAEGEYKYSKEWINKMSAYNYYLVGYEKKMDDNNSVKEALTLFSKSYELMPNNYLALANRASCYIILNDYKNALKDLNKVIEIRPDNFQSYSSRMYVKSKLEDFKGALSDISKALELRPNYPGYYTDRGHIKTLMGDSIGSIKDFEKAISLDVNDKYALNLLGFMEMNIKKDYKSANKNLKMAIEKELDDPFASKSSGLYFDYSCALDKIGDYKEALENIEIAIACDPDNSEYYLKSGEINARAKNIKKACEEWNTAKRLDQEKAEELLLYNCKN